MYIYCYSNMFKNEHNHLEINDHFFLGGGGRGGMELKRVIVLGQYEQVEHV